MPEEHDVETLERIAVAMLNEEPSVWVFTPDRLIAQPIGGHCLYEMIGSAAEVLAGIETVAAAATGTATALDSTEAPGLPTILGFAQNENHAVLACLVLDNGPQGGLHITRIAPDNFGAMPMTAFISAHVFPANTNQRSAS